MNEGFSERVKLAQGWGRALIKCMYFIQQKILKAIKVSFRICQITDLDNTVRAKPGLVYMEKMMEKLKENLNF